jgi:serine/threonine-protein kinase
VVTFATLTVLLFAAVLLGLSPSLNPIAVLTGDGFDVDVPRVVELTQTQALLDLEAAKLRGEVDFGYSSTVARGIVISQEPTAGRRAPRGSPVRLVVSRGPSRIPVPDLAGLTEKRAVARLADLGLESSVDRVNDEVVPAGAVIRQNPPAGEILSGGQRVALVVSLGPVERTVPQVSTISLEGALFTLGKAGLTLGTVSYADDARLPEGAVIGVLPSPGTVVPRDTPIDVVVSNGPPPVPVPSLVGGTQANAASQLAKLGLVAGEVSSFAPSAAADGTVLAQSPAPGTLLRVGQVVTLTVQRAAPAAAPTTTVPG